MQNRIADAITRFAGSMMFVYIHMVAQMIFRIKELPIAVADNNSVTGDNLSDLCDDKSGDRCRTPSVRCVADQQWKMVQGEDHQNRELLDIPNQILE